MVLEIESLPLSAALGLSATFCPLYVCQVLACIFRPWVIFSFCLWLYSTAFNETWDVYEACVIQGVCNIL